MFKKFSLVLACLVGLSTTAATAADISHTQSWGTSVSTAQVDRTVTGNVTENTIKYATDRSDFSKPTIGCGTACPGAGNVDNSVVSASLDYQIKDSKLNEVTKGVTQATDTFCDTSISGGIITATQGVRDSKSVSDLTTTKDNVTTIKGYNVKVDTSTNDGAGYPGKGKGNDVTVDLGNGSSFDTAGAFTVKSGVTQLGDVKVVDFNPVKGTENGIGLSYTSTDLKVNDKTVTKVHDESFSKGSYSSLK